MKITEALAELKTIEKRIEKKAEFVRSYAYRQGHLRDPHEKDGGSRILIEREQQAITDLEERVVALRRGIATANAMTTLTLHGHTRTIADWLVWRREVAPRQRDRLTALAAVLDAMRKQTREKGLTVKTSGEAETQAEVIVHLDELALAKGRESVEQILGDLDGQLSLHNATVEVTI